MLGIKWFLCIILFDVCLVVFNATFSNISVIPWRLVLLVEATGVPGEIHRPSVASHWQTLCTSFNGKLISNISSHKHLCVTLSHDAKWSEHVENIAKNSLYFFIFLSFPIETRSNWNIVESVVKNHEPTNILKHSQEKNWVVKSINE